MAAVHAPRGESTQHHDTPRRSVVFISRVCDVSVDAVRGVDDATDAVEPGGEQELTAGIEVHASALAVVELVAPHSRRARVRVEVGARSRVIRTYSRGVSQVEDGDAAVGVPHRDALAPDGHRADRGVVVAPRGASRV